MKFGVHALELWYDMLYKFYKNWIRDASVFEWILSAIVQQFFACNSGGRIEIWLQSKNQMKLKFLQLLEYLVIHISTKFRGHWICTLGVIDYFWKGIESARKVTIIGLI